MSPTPSGGPARPHRSFPLSPADRAAGRSPEAQAAIDARLGPLISGGLLDPMFTGVASALRLRRVKL